MTMLAIMAREPRNIGALCDRLRHGVARASLAIHTRGSNRIGQPHMTNERWRQLEELYDAVVDLSPAERSVRLKDFDPELRTVLEAILAQEGSALEHPAWEDCASLLETGTHLKAGSQLGPYKIERQVGAGGMGEVYRATDTRLGRQVAIKTYRQEFGERFQREARVIASLNHRHICCIYDVGPDYLVMELLEGETLAA
jgi:eukaryotic-like serine/threonine-protein kinase